MSDQTDQMRRSVQAIIATHDRNIPIHIIDQAPAELIQSLPPRDLQRLRDIRTLRKACTGVVPSCPSNVGYISRFRSKHPIANPDTIKLAVEKLIAASRCLDDPLASDIRRLCSHIFGQRSVEEATRILDRMVFTIMDSRMPFSRSCYATVMIVEVFRFLVLHDTGENHLVLRELVLSAGTHSADGIGSDLWRAALRSTKKGWWNIQETRHEDMALADCVNNGDADVSA